MKDDDPGDREAELQRILAGLTPREAKVLRERFGATLDNFTLEDVGNQFEVVRQRIREIESNRRNPPPDGDPEDAA